MKIVIFAATTLELNGLLNTLDKPSIKQPILQYQKKIAKHQVDFVITGIGLVASAFAASKIDLKSYDLIISAGIAGSFDKKIALGDCVQIKEERIIELGAEDDKNWLRTKAMGLNEPDTFSLKITQLPQSIKQKLSKLKKVKAISANTAHGNSKSIASILSLYPAQIESMEGASIAYAADKIKVTLLAIRSISNYVEKRDKSKWQIPLAIKNLNAFLLQLLNQIQ